MQTVKAEFRGGVFVPMQPTHLPEGSIVEIPLPSPGPAASPAEADTPLMKLVRLMDQFPVEDPLPADAAAQYEHYLYGLPRQP